MRGTIRPHKAEPRMVVAHPYHLGKTFVLLITEMDGSDYRQAAGDRIELHGSLGW